MIAAAGILLGMSLLWMTGRHPGSLDGVRLQGAVGFVLLLGCVSLLPLLAHSPALGRLTLAVWLGLMSSLLILSLINGREIPGFRLVALGVGLNLLVIAANGAMPVDASAIASVGGQRQALLAMSADRFHASTTSRTRLRVLSDVLPVAARPPLRSVISVGDLLMVVGIGCVLLSADGERLRGRVPRVSRESRRD